MPDITSVTNQQVKDTVKLQQKKFRAQTHEFLLEGYKPIFEAFHAGINIKTIFVLEKNVQKFEFCKDKIVTVNEAVLEKVSTTESMPEAVAVASQRTFNIEEIKQLKRLVLLENVKDAGNLGTIIRSAAAFDLEAIVLCGDTTDIYNPKVVRSAVGALFKLPVLKIKNIDEIGTMKADFIATVVNHKDIVNPESIDYEKPFVLMFGSEADGLSEAALRTASIKTTIPISKKTESLNLSTAASIMFYISAKN